ncbi:MAG: tetratricopeptide repeat protein [Anaerolineales bacterium]|jgi:tetratricopeptide (TPR) repeat protein
MNENKIPESDLLIQQLQVALTSANQQDDPAVKCSALMKLGQAYLDKKEAPDALTQFEEALRIVKKTKDKEMQARLFGYKGLALKMLGNYGMALQAFRKSNGIASNLGHDLLLCDSYYQIGILKSEMANQNGNLDDLTQAFEISTRLQDSARKMRIAAALADNFYAHKTFDKAHEYYGIAFEQARNLGNLEGECSFLTKLANVSLAAGELKTAIRQYERALDVASAIENRNAEINILGGLFRANALADHANLAIVYGEKTIQLAREIEHFDAEITNIHALASFLIDQDQISKALAYLDEGQKLADKNQRQEWSSALLVESATAYRKSGDLQAAVEPLKQALSLATGIGDKHAITKILGYLSVIEAERDLLSESTTYAERALEFAGELNDSGLTGENQMLLAFNYRDLGQVDRAIRYCQAAIASYKDNGDSGMVEKVETLLAELRE